MNDYLPFFIMTALYLAWGAYMIRLVRPTKMPPKPLLPTASPEERKQWWRELEEYCRAYSNKR